MAYLHLAQSGYAASGVVEAQSDISTALAALVKMRLSGTQNFLGYTHLVQRGFDAENNRFIMT